MSDQVEALTPAQQEQQNQMIQQVQLAMENHENKHQAAKQMIDELTNANVSLRTATLTMQKQIQQLMNARQFEAKQAADKVFELEKKLSGGPITDEVLREENAKLTAENDRLNRVVGALDRELSTIKSNGAVHDDLVGDETACNAPA